MKQMKMAGRRRPSLSAAAGMLLAGLWSQQAQAQEAVPVPDADKPAADVVVTAERISSLARTTPVSVGVIGQREIETKGIMDLHDIVGVVAGVAVPNGFSNQPQAVAIRGVGASLPAMSQAVGIYLDDVPLIRGYATGLWDLPDIERIEVLRGPQGTLYGQNSSAGAVKFISREPDARSEAWVSASAGNRGALETRGYLNGPLDRDALTASLAFSRRTNDGFAYNAALDKNANKLDVAQFRAKLRWAGPQGGIALLAVDGAQDRSDADTSNFPLNHANAAPRVAFNTKGGTGAFKRNAGGASLTWSEPLAEGVLLRSITAFRRYRDDPTVADFGGLEVQRYAISQTVEQKAFSQEVQLQGKQKQLSWTAGVMLVRDRFDFDRYTTVAPLAAPAPVYTEALTHLDTTDLGAYAQGRYAVSGATGVTTGLRAYRTRQSGSNQFWNTTANGEHTAQVYAAPSLSTGTSGVLPKLGVDHQWDADTFLYASVAEGAKFGGFNRAAESLASAQVATSPEKVRTYEAGIKSTARAGLTASLALFYNDYRDYLAALSNTRINGVQVNDSVLLNAGAARTYGADLELAASLGPHTRWTVSLELLRSRFSEFANPSGAAATNFVGNELPNAPHLTMGSSVYHVLPLGDGATLALDLSAQYLRRSFIDVANTALVAVPNQVYVNAALSYRPARSNWHFSLRARNLGDKSYPLLRTKIASLGLDSAYYNPPRTILSTARYDF